MIIKVTPKTTETIKLNAKYKDKIRKEIIHELISIIIVRHGVPRKLRKVITVMATMMLNNLTNANGIE